MIESLFPRQLEYFTELYRTLDYATASRTIPITYQGLKSAITALEDHIGEKLFLSSGEGLVPTPYADSLFKMSNTWLQGLRNFEDDLNRLRAAKSTPVRLCAAFGIPSSLGSDVAEAFGDRYPDLCLSIEEYTDEAAEEMLRTGLHSIALLHAPYPEYVDVVSLGTQPACFFVNKNNRLAAERALSLEDISGENVMLPDARFKANRMFFDVIDKRGIGLASISYCHNIMDSYLFALNDKGIGLGLTSVGKEFAGQDSVVSIPISDWSPYEYGITWKKGYELKDYEKKLIGFLKRDQRYATPNATPRFP